MIELKCENKEITKPKHQLEKNCNGKLTKINRCLNEIKRKLSLSNGSDSTNNYAIINQMGNNLQSD